MDGLAAYSDSDDSDNDQPPAPPATNTTKPTSSTTKLKPATKTNKKGRKVLSLSNVIPADIYASLTRGSTDTDSDSDEEEASKRKKLASRTASGKKGGGLLNKLKGIKPSDKPVTVVQSSSTTTTAQSTQKLGFDLSQLTSASVTTITTKKGSSGGAVVDIHGNGGLSTSTGAKKATRRPLLPAKKTKAYTAPTPTRSQDSDDDDDDDNNSSSIISSAVNNLKKKRQFSAANSQYAVSNKGAHVGPSAPPTGPAGPAPPQNNHVQQKQQQQQYVEVAPPQPQFSDSDFNQNQSSKSNKRRKRDMELALLSGDTANVAIAGAIESSTGLSTSNASWADEYSTSGGGDEGDSAPTMIKMYDPKTGETKMVSGGSDQARRKGHVNQLVANAARMEEIMVRDKAKLGKTKKQTNAKYGW